VDLLLYLPEDLEKKFVREVIQEFTKDEDMYTLKSMEFSNQLHLALYGESWDDKREREKTLTVTNLLKLETLSTEQIANAVNVSVEFVEKIKAKIENL